MSVATRRCAYTLMLMTAALGPAWSQQPYPNRSVRLVVGFAAGGPTDVPARYIAAKLSDMLGQPVVVENKPGAGGLLATRDVLMQPKDGYNLLLCTHFEPINTVLYQKPQYELSDLAPIALIEKYYYSLLLANTVPATDLASFIAFAKAHPREISYATLGLGSAQELFARQFERLTAIAMNPVPYRGSAQAVQDLLAGRVQFQVTPLLTALPFLKSQQVRVLAVSSPHRQTLAPQVPTLKELGFEFERIGWLGVCAATGTPQHVVDLLNKAITEIVATPDYQSMSEGVGLIGVSSTPEELGNLIKQTRAEVESTILEFNLQR